jgi:hypothetical protein
MKPSGVLLRELLAVAKSRGYHVHRVRQSWSFSKDNVLVLTFYHHDDNQVLLSDAQVAEALSKLK